MIEKESVCVCWFYDRNISYAFSCIACSGSAKACKSRAAKRQPNAQSREQQRPATLKEKAVEFHPSQNHHKMVWLGGDLQDHPVPPPVRGRNTFHCSRLLSAPFNLPLSTARNGASTASLFQCPLLSSAGICTSRGLPSATELQAAV